MPTNLIGWERRIRAFAAEHDLEIGNSKTQRLALKVHKRAQRMQDVDPDDLIRSVLDYKDPTGETAVANVMDPRPVAPTYRPIDVTSWSHDDLERMHLEDELAQDQYAADLAAWEKRNAARNGAAA